MADAHAPDGADSSVSIPAQGAASHSCGGCGARVEFVPGTQVLRCPYCGYEQQLAAPDREVREHAYQELARLPRKPVATVGAHLLSCARCGARSESNALSDRCQFCGAPLVAEPASDGLIAPEAVLPFQVDRKGVRTALRRWVSTRWFAPSGLKKVTAAESVRGTYLPHWTYDARTVSHYRGQRGEHYWVTETYTVTVNGRSETRTRSVRKTRWYPANGTVWRDFDDVLVPGTERVSGDDLEKLGPWPLTAAAPYQPDYLAGYQTLRYDVEPETGLVRAKEEMAPVIERDCRHDIGGDEQRVHSVNTRYSGITFKLMLLPVWIACYLYGGRTYQVLVNGSTAAVTGQRPYSAIKIVAAVVAALAVLALIIFLFVRYGGK